MFSVFYSSEKYQFVILNMIVVILLICVEYGHSRRICQDDEEETVTNISFGSCNIIEDKIFHISKFLELATIYDFDNYTLAPQDDKDENTIIMAVSLERTSAYIAYAIAHFLNDPTFRLRFLWGMEFLSGAIPIAIEDFCRRNGDLNFTFM